MAPRPKTPSVLPCSSDPANCFFLASINGPMSSALIVGASSLMKRIPPTISLEANNIPAATSSLTALALAPGVLKTTTPRSVQASMGILLTPAPARAMAVTEGPMSDVESLKLLNKMASGVLISLLTSKQSRLSRSRPLAEIALYVRTLYMSLPFYC